ncbi:MAG: NAD(+) synthase [Thermovirgaceae bacterium]
MVPLQSFYRDPGMLAVTIEEWLENRLRSSGRCGGVVGLSGGIDSAVVAAMLKNVCRCDMLAVIMPCHSLEEDVRDAYRVARALDLPHTLVDLTPVYESLTESVSMIQQSFDRLPLANVKPRLRMTTLYLLGQQHKYLVCGTGNKAELTIGYYTKYGDSGVDVLPLGDLLKGEVREVARYLGVPEEIVSKPPSAGLWKGQTDEGEIGMDYDMIDSYLAGGKVPEKVRRKIEAMRDRSSHKREMPPVCRIDTNAEKHQR